MKEKGKMSLGDKKPFRFRTHNREHIEMVGYVPPYRQPLSYLIGTPEERGVVDQTERLAAVAVKKRNFVDIGEKPGDLCDVCLKWTCSDSVVRRENRDVEKRERVFEAVKKDPRFEGIEFMLRSIRRLPMSDEYARECRSRLSELIDEHWGNY